MIIKIKKPVLLIFLVAFIAAVSVLVERSQNDQEVISTVAHTTAKDEIIISLLEDHMVQASNIYYEEYTRVSPTIARYDTEIKKIYKPDSGVYRIVFGTYPFVGPHLYLGYNEITFDISPDGYVTLHAFHPIKANNDLPENYKDLILKPLPELVK